MTMKRIFVLMLLLASMLTSCYQPVTNTPSIPSIAANPAGSTNAESEHTIAEIPQPDRTFEFELLPEDMKGQNIQTIFAQAELGYSAHDPSVLYERFPEIVTAEVTAIGVGRNYSETKDRYTMTFSPITIKVDQVWKGSYFREGETISLFVYGGYLPYRELEKSFLPEDIKAQQTKLTMTEEEKNSTWYFEEFDGRSFPEVGKKYLLHVYRDDYGEHYISGWGLGIQEIDPMSNILPSGQTVEEYMKDLQ
jgi:hypothetical protein